MTDALTGDFWTDAGALFELASTVGEHLETSRDLTSVAKQVRVLADAIPRTRESLSEIDPYLSSAMLAAVVQALRADEDDRRGDLRVAIEQIRQALRDMLDEQPVWRGGAKHAAVWLRAHGLSTRDLAELLDVGESTVRRWSSTEDDTAPTGDNELRVLILAKAVNHLRHAMTARGAMQWLQRPHPVLNGERPIDHLDDPDAYRQLVHLASGTRSFVAS